MAKSFVTFAVKPDTAERDLNELAQRVLEIAFNGLEWKSDYHLIDIAFGMKKIQIGCVIEDDRINVDDVTERIESLEGVTSADIEAFSKI